MEKLKINELLTKAANERASDVHLSVGRYPTFRIDSKLFALKSYPEMNDETMNSLVGGILNDQQRALLQKNYEVDFSYSLPERMRFRVSVFYQKGHLSAAFRLIKFKIPSLEELNLPRQVGQFVNNKSGLVLFVGPTGHGKSTTIASLVDMINHSRDEHIITIEDPIEYVFQADRSIINQREIGKDVLSFTRGLQGALREDVDVMLVGEMRDQEAISVALVAAETGHLVFAPVHTNDAVQGIERIINIFPYDLQNQIRSQIANSLIGVVSQRLIPQINGGRVPAVEVLFNNGVIADLIKKNQMDQIHQVIESSADQGMIPLNNSLADLVKAQLVTKDHAMMYSSNIQALKMLIR